MFGLIKSRTSSSIIESASQELPISKGGAVFVLNAPLVNCPREAFQSTIPLYASLVRCYQRTLKV